MTFLLNLLIGQWAKYFWPTVALLAVFFYWKHLTSKIDSLQHDKRELEASIVVYKENEVKLTDSIKQQNDSIATMHKQFVALSKTAIELAKGANADNKNLTNKLAGQLQSIRSIDTPKDCQSAIDLIIDVAKVNKWSPLKEQTK